MGMGSGPAIGKHRKLPYGAIYSRSLFRRRRQFPAMAEPTAADQVRGPRQLRPGALGTSAATKGRFDPSTHSGGLLTKPGDHTCPWSSIP